MDARQDAAQRALDLLEQAARELDALDTMSAGKHRAIQARRTLEVIISRLRPIAGAAKPVAAKPHSPFRRVVAALGIAPTGDRLQ